MKNTVLEHRKENVEFMGNELTPLKSVDFKKLRDYIKSNLNMFYMKTVQENIRFEVLAMREYNDSSIWDILFLLNYGEYGFMNFIKDNDWVQNVIESEYQEQVNFYGLNYNKARLYSQIAERIEGKNEVNRKVFFIHREYIPKFKEDLKGMTNEY